MERIYLDACHQLLDLVIRGRKPPSVFCEALGEFEDFVDKMGSIDFDLVQGVRSLDRKALEVDDLDPAVWKATRETVAFLGRKISSSTLSVSLFTTPSPKRCKQHHLSRWLTSNFRLVVTPKDVWLSGVRTAVVAIRWLSFRAELRRKPAPLMMLAEAIASCQGRNKRKKADGEEDEDGKESSRAFEAEVFHYDLMEVLAIHAASGQPGLDLKRLRRAANIGEDISVLLDGRTTALEMKRFLNKQITGDSLEKVMALAEEVDQLLYYMLESEHWTGRQTGALIFAHLLFCIEAVFTNGKVEKLTVAPGFPAFCGSKDPLLELYDRSKLYHGKDSTDPDFVFSPAPSDGFKGLVKLVDNICLINGVELAPLCFVTNSGAGLEVAVGEELVYSGRNSVVLSCRDIDAEKASSVFKVAPQADSLREEGYHSQLDKVDGVRRKLESGLVHGAGSGLRFIRLQHYGTAFRPAHVARGRAREFAVQACATIQGMHELGVLHRDIKPDNFIVVDEATLLLNDFDLSCHIADEDQRRYIAGTPMFKSPRLVDGGLYLMEDDWMALGLTFMYLLGSYHSDVTKVAALRRIQNEEWAPDVLKTNVATGLLSMENVAEEPVPVGSVGSVKRSARR